MIWEEVSAPGSDAASRAGTLERVLADPWDARNPLSFRAIAASHDRGVTSASGLSTLSNSNFVAEFVPSRYGGRLIRLDELARVIRPVARRDAGLALAGGLADFRRTAPVWCAGDPVEAQRVADDVLTGRFRANAQDEAGNEANDEARNEASDEAPDVSERASSDGARSAEALIGSAACGALVGMADTALRLASVAEIEQHDASGAPHNTWCRPALAESFTDLLMADALTIAAARAVTFFPDQCRLITAVASYLVPRMLGESLYRLSLSLAHAGRGHQIAQQILRKTVRELSDVAFGLGATARFSAIAEQELPRVAASEWVEEQAAPLTLFAPHEWAPDLEPGRVAWTGGLDGITGFLDLVAQSTPAAHRQDPAGPLLELCTAQLRQEAARVQLDCLAHGASLDQVSHRDGQSLAQRYALIIGGTCCLGVWLSSASSDFLGRSDWAVAALHAILKRLDRPSPELPADLQPRLCAEVLRRTASRESYDLYRSSLTG